MIAKMNKYSKSHFFCQIINCFKKVQEDVNNIVRIHFAKKDETLYAALDRLSQIKEKML